MTTPDKMRSMGSMDFWISKCPMKIYDRFTAFSKENSNNNYSFALKLLLDGYEGNIKEAVLFEQYIELKERLVSLELEVKELLNKGEPERKVPKCVGSSGMVKKKGDDKK